MCQSLLHIVFKNFITTYCRLLQNVVFFFTNLDRKCITLLHNEALLHNVVLQSLM